MTSGVLSPRRRLVRPARRLATHGSLIPSAPRGLHLFTESPRMAVIGIDFGNLNCVIAQAGRGGVDVLLNGASKRQVRGRLNRTP